ncbi:MAG: hypothetical protein J0M00_26675 [Burkholderiales bacterium]|nr:hypothetical protein [Burkholderiales bacterium]
MQAWTRTRRNPDSQAIRQAIQKLLIAHAASPFHILREAGATAELRTLLLQKLEAIGRMCSAIRMEHAGARSRFTWPPSIETLRVQLELKIQRGRAPTKTGSSTDLVLLQRSRRPVTLTCYSGGPGDVVACVDAADVVAAVEVKASPSRSRQQWPAAGFEDTLLRCKTKPEVVHGNETAVQPGVQA